MISLRRYLSSLNASNGLLLALLLAGNAIRPAEAAFAPGDCLVNGGNYICTEPQLRTEPWSYGGFTFDVNPTYHCPSGYNAGQCEAQGGEFNSCAGGCKNIQIPFRDDTIPYIGNETLLNMGACSVSHVDTGWGDAGAYDWLDAHSEEWRYGILTRQYRNLEFSGIRSVESDCDSAFQDVAEARRYRSVTRICPAGHSEVTLDNGDLLCVRAFDASCSIGNPVRPASGEKLHRETDFAMPGSEIFRVQRFYRSYGYFRPFEGDGTDTANITEHTDYWRFTWDSRIVFTPQSSQILAVADRPGNRLEYFDANGVGMHLYSGSRSRLESVRNSGGNIVAWLLKDGDGRIEEYDPDGKLLAIETRSGERVDIAHDAESRPSVITHHSGRRIDISYDWRSRPTSITVPGGESIQYRWDGIHRLRKVTLPDATVREYQWGAHYWDELLVGIIDETGSQYASYTYDGGGKVYRSEHAGGVDLWQTQVSGAYTHTTVTTPAGLRQTHFYESSDGIAKSDTMDQKCEFCSRSFSNIDYNADGLPVAETDFNGNTTTYTYNTAGLEISRTEAVGTAEEYTVTTSWDTSLRLPLEIVDGDRKTSFTYDSRGRTLTRTVTDLATGESRVWRYTYCMEADANDPSAHCPVEGLRKSVDGPRTDVADSTQYFYYTDDAADGSHRVGDLWQVVNAEGHVTEYTAYDPAGRVIEVQRPNGIYTRFAYDPRGRLTGRRVVDPAGGPDVITAFTYDATGNLTRVTRPDGSYLDYTYNAAHRLVALADASGNRIDYTLDNAGNRTAETVTGPAGTVFSERTRQYNDLNRLVKEINGLAQETVHAYDPEGNRTNTTDPAGHATSHQYDALNRLSRTVDALNGGTDYSYDDQDRLTGVSDPRNVATDYEYDAFGDLLREVSADAGTTTYAYDAAGNRVSRTDARGVSTDYQYDGLGRLTRIDHAGGETITFDYDQGTYSKGRLTGIVNQTTGDSITYTHDFQGRVIEDRRVITDQTLATAYEHDSAGRVTAVTYPSGARVDITRDADGRPSAVSLTVDGATRTLASGIQYAPFGPLSQLTWGDGSVLTRQFDAAGRLTEQQTDGFQHLAWTYAADGNITALDDLADPQQSQTFAYDALHRLTGADGAYGSLGYAYDAVGNRTRLTEDGNATDYTYAADSNRLLQAGAESYDYDAMGNATQAGSLAFSYDAKGRMTSVDPGKGQPVTYRVNALGQRSVKTDKKNRLFAYDTKGHLIGEYDDKGAAIREYVYLGDRPLAMVVPGRKGTAVYFVHTDHLGTPKLLTDEAGKVVWEGLYRPFGQVSASGKVEQPLRFPGQYADEESGLHYNYFRDYEPGAGRYIESDPIGLDGGINKYGYSYQNPLSYIDPDGRAAIVIPLVPPACKAISAGLGSLIGVIAYHLYLDCDDDNDGSCGDEEEEECRREIRECEATCRRAQTDPDMKEIWGGSWAKCMLGCVPWRCMDYL